MIKIIGIGPGNAKYLTQQSMVALSKSPCIIGTQRQLETIESFSEGTLLVYNGKLSHLEELISHVPCYALRFDKTGKVVEMLKKL